MSQENTGPGKKIVNGGLHLTNIVEVKEYTPLLVQTLDQIIELLSAHCGPYSRYAMIASQSNILGFDPNVFMKDGIKILESIEYISPIQTYLKNTLAYVGQRVDNRAKDGTTTAQLFSAFFLKNCLANREAAGITKLTTSQLEDSFALLLKIVDDYMGKHQWTLEDLQKEFGAPEDTDHVWAGNVAYMQALSSSGGHTGLAKCLKEVFTNTPRDGWSLQHQRMSHLETSIPFSVEYSDHDFAIPAAVVTQEVLNVAMNSEYRVEGDVRVLAVPQEITADDTMMARLVSYLEAYPDEEDTPHLAIICIKADAQIIQLLKSLNTKRNKPIGMFFRMEFLQGINTNGDLPLHALNAIASVKIYNPAVDTVLQDEHFIKAKLAYFNGKEFRLGGVVEYNPGEVVHPNYSDPSRCPNYTSLLHHVQDLIEKHESRHQIVSESIKERCDQIAKLLVCPKAPMLFIGGTTHEHTSNRTVVQDAIGATMASISHGFFINGLLSIKQVLDHVAQDSLRSQISVSVGYEGGEQLPIRTGKADSVLMGHYGPKTDLEFFRFLLKMLQESMGNVIEILYGPDYFLPGSADIMPNVGLRNTRYSNLLDLSGEHSLTEFLQGIQNQSTSTEAVSNYPIIQPTNIYRELFKRAGELLIRLIATDKFIIPGGVVVADNISGPHAG